MMLIGLDKSGQKSDIYHTARQERRKPKGEILMKNKKYYIAYGSNLSVEQMNIAQISFLLGHSQLETTMIYLDITMEQEAAALATLEDESDRNAVPKWNPDTDSLSSICGLRKLQ